MGNESRMKNRNMEAGGGGSAWGSPDRMGVAEPHGEPVPMADLA